MARTRNIKPGFFRNEQLGACSPLARLFFAGLWCWADRAGRLESRPEWLRGQILPFDQVSGRELLRELAEKKDWNGTPAFLFAYRADNGREYIQITNFPRHQSPHAKEQNSEIPPPVTNARCMSETGTGHLSGMQQRCAGVVADISSASERVDNGQAADMPVVTAGACTPLYVPLVSSSSSSSSISINNNKHEEYGDSNNEESFLLFWGNYPRHEAEKRAKEEWVKQPAADRAKIIAAAKNYANICHTKRTEDKFVKLGHNFLAGQSWKDFIPVLSKSLPPPPPLPVQVNPRDTADKLENPELAKFLARKNQTPDKVEALAAAVVAKIG